jgi:hypothetical protein
VTYDGNAHTASGNCTGVGGPTDVLSGLTKTGTTHTDAGDWPTDAWSFTDTTGNYNNNSGTVHDHIDQASAKANYTGALFASGPTSPVTVTLSATITVGSGLDVRNATVQFVNRDNSNAVLCSPTIGLVNSTDTTVGTATCNVPLAFSATQGSTQYTIGIIVGRDFTDNNSAEDSVVTVSQQTSGMITGGGFLLNQASGGLYPGQAGLKTNFGFNVKYNKAGTNLQGNINVIIRNGGRIYQIKGNSMTSLANQVNSSGSGGTSTFNGKASIQDITNPNAPPISIDGGASLQVTMHDNGDPGSSDTIGITVWNKSGGMWFSSNWNGSATIEQLLGGGNLVVH